MSGLQSEFHPHCIYPFDNIRRHAEDLSPRAVGLRPQRTCQALLQEIPALIDTGLAGFRLSPQNCDMVAVTHLYRGVMAGLIEPQQALRELAEVYPDAPFSNGFHHQREGAAWVAKARSAAFGD